MALSADRSTQSRTGDVFSHPMAAAVKSYLGGIAVLDSAGNCKPGVTATGLIPCGRFRQTVDNLSGAAAAKSVEVEPGIFKWSNSAASDEITKAQIGDVCYIVDDETVAKTNGGGTRSPAGVIRAVDTDGVWVEIPHTFGADGDLVAANNLSDVASAATARANLAANKLPLDLVAADLRAAQAKVYRVVSPVAGLIKKIYTVLEGAALATGDCTLTGKIGSTAITNGVVTITQAGSAVGDVDVATPTAANEVAIGDVISVTVGGANTDATATAKVTVYIET